MQAERKKSLGKKRKSHFHYPKEIMGRMADWLLAPIQEKKYLLQESRHSIGIWKSQKQHSLGRNIQSWVFCVRTRCLLITALGSVCAISVESSNRMKSLSVKRMS